MKKIFSLLILGIIAWPLVSGAYVSSSANYRLERDSLNFSGGLGTSANYLQENTIGESATGRGTGGTYLLEAGYQQANPAPTPTPTPPPTPPPSSGGRVVVSIPGCTNPLASNFNPAATVNNGSCILSEIVSNVGAFSAVGQPGNQQIRLSWINPIFANFSAVRIVRSTSGVVTEPTAGTIIYDDAGENAFDSAVTAGQTYYYTAFVRSNSGLYSSGAFTSILISTGEEATPPPGPSEPPGVGPAADPFNDLPMVISTNPLIRSFSLDDFLVIQIGELAKIFSNQKTVSINRAKETVFRLAYERIPEVLKTIGLTIIDSATGQPYSFLLRVNQDKTAYLATIPPFLRPGTYPLFIHLINYQDQSVKRLEGTLIVAGVGASLTLAVGQITKDLGGPVLISVGVVSGLLPALTATTQITSLYDIYLFLMRGIGAILGALGWRRRRQPWGTVYDSVTKRPIDPAYVSVRLANQDKEIASAITDIDGRYGLFLPPGTYRLAAGKTHYQFPSARLAGRSTDELYDQLYFGEAVTTTGSDVLTRNIPLDPTGFDWNEFVKSKQQFFRLYSRKELWRHRLAESFFAVGLALTIAGVAFTPSWFNLSLLTIYLLIYLAGRWWRAAHPIVLATKNKEPLSFAVIRAWLPYTKQQIKTVVTDVLGRFYFLVRPGIYYFTIDEKLVDGSYQQIYQSAPMALKKGVLTHNFDL